MKLSRAACSLVVVAQVAATAATASAQPTAAQARPADIAPIALEYVAPPGCPDEISLRAGVIVRLGYDPFHGGAPRHAFVDVQPTSLGFIAALELREPGRAPSQRSIGPASRCEDVIAALELALVVVIDPARAAPSAPAVQAPQAAATPSTPAPSAPTSYEPPGWRIVETKPAGPPTHELAFILGAVSGAHPETEGYVGLRAGYLVGEYLRIGLLGRIASGNGDLDTTRTYETRTAELAVETCARRWLAFACGVVGFGSKSVTIHRYDELSGYGTVADYSNTYALIGGSAALDVPLGRVFLRPTVEVAVPLPKVEIESEGVMRAELAPVQLSFDLAIGGRW